LAPPLVTRPSARLTTRSQRLKSARSWVMSMSVAPVRAFSVNRGP
jgi:hypothetical protein